MRESVAFISKVRLYEHFVFIKVESSILLFNLALQKKIPLCIRTRTIITRKSTPYQYNDIGTTVLLKNETSFLPHSIKHTLMFLLDRQSKY